MSAPIVGGAEDTTNVAVVPIFHRSVACSPEDPAFACTGTLVAPRAVLTAAHCLEGQPPNALEVEVGGVVIPVSGGAAHPMFDDTLRVNDIALLVLEAPAPLTVPPIAIASSVPDLVGQDVTLVGFGATSGTSSDIGTRRAGAARVGMQSAEELRVTPDPAMSCRGDSGGPVLHAGEVVGVTSYGDPACTQYGVAMRVDHQSAFLQPLLAEAAAPPARRAFDPGEDLCATTCGTDADCPAETACFAGQCSYHGLPAARLGDECTTDGAQACVALPGGGCRTLVPCAAEPIPGDDGCGCHAQSGGAWLLVLAMAAVARGRRTGRTARRRDR